MLLESPIAEATQQLYQVAQIAQEQQFAAFCDDLADYGASVGDHLKRKRAGTLLFILGRARGELQGQPQKAAGYDETSPFAEPHYGQQQQPYAAQPPSQYPAPQRQALEPPHPHEAFFREYMQLGGKAGARAVSDRIAGFEDYQIREFAKMFRDYASSLRNPDAIKTAIAISNQIAVQFHDKTSAARLALPAPGRRN